MKKNNRKNSARVFARAGRHALKRAAALILAFAIVICELPFFASPVLAADVTGTNSFRSTAKLGTVTFASGKSKYGTWWMSEVGGYYNTFCMSLHKGLSTGDSFNGTYVTYSTSSSSASERALAYIGLWEYSVYKNNGGYLTKQQWKMAASLVWSVNEGGESEEELVAVIKQVINGGFPTSRTAQEWYNGVLTANEGEAYAIKWTYAGSSTDKQTLISFYATTDVSKDLEIDFDIQKYTKSTLYRQRIHIHKEDDEGNALQGVAFNISIADQETYDAFYSYNLVGEDLNESGDVTDITLSDGFTATTNSSGNINLRLTFDIVSSRYGYLSTSDLAEIDAWDDEVAEYVAAGGSASDLEYVSSAAICKAVKALMDERDLLYADDLSYSGAKELAAAEIEELFEDVENTYLITELYQSEWTMDDDEKYNYLVDEDYAEGVTLTISSANSWLKDNDTYADYDGWADRYWAVENDSYASAYPLRVVVDVTDKCKYVDVTFEKQALDSSGDVCVLGLGDTDVAEGGTYALYESDTSDGDAEAIETFTINEDGYLVSNSEGTLSEENGASYTMKLKTGKTYYLKEITAPEGYVLNETVYTLYWAGADYEDSENVTADATDRYVYNRIKIRKYTNYTGSGFYLTGEENAVFEVYLSKYSSYEDAVENGNEDEYTIMTTDEGGIATSKLLVYGTYVVHQIDGDEKTLLADDTTVTIDEDYEDSDPVELAILNKELQAYLRIIKKDSTTGNTVLKSGTAYQIYSCDEETGELSLVTQSTSNGNTMVEKSTWTTDETGTIITYEPLSAGTYCIYEVDVAHGYARNSAYLEIKIDRDSIEIEEIYDDDGNLVNAYYVCETEFVNNPVTGKIKLTKTGNILTGATKYLVDKDGSLIEIEEEDAEEETGSAEEDNTCVEFEYESTYLSGAVFEIRAAGDIYTQDGQGTILFEDGSLVCTITTGEGAVFTNECDGICEYALDEETGAVEVTLPLGSYCVTETASLYGYILDETVYSVTFEWEGGELESVVNSNVDTPTDEDGNLIIDNELALGGVTINKTDETTGVTLSGAVFGIYTTDNIYSSAGELLVEAGSLITTITTDESGVAESGSILPLMSEGYVVEEETEDDADEEAADSEAAADEDTEEEQTLNSGNYYIKEISAPDGYYISEETYEFHLEYEETVSFTIDLTNTPTDVIISKRAVSGSDELYGASLEIRGSDGNVVASWISGDAESIVVSDSISASLTESGSIEITGLAFGTYTLVETKSAAGYAYAEDISFTISEEKPDEPEEVIMYDDTTKVQITKYDITNGEELAGASLAIYDSEGNLIDEWVSTDESHYIEGVLVAGEDYTLTEVIAPDGYEIANNITFTVSLDGSIDVVEMYDELTPEEDDEDEEEDTPQTYDTPKTGSLSPFKSLLIIFLCGLAICDGIREKRIWKK